MFDLTLTHQLGTLLELPVEQRDAKWEEKFFPAIWNASIVLPTNPIFTGPDGSSYFRLSLPAPGTFESNSLANLASLAVVNLSGAALFTTPTEEKPSYVLSMGLLDSLIRHDSWRGDRQDEVEARHRSEHAQIISGKREESGAERITLKTQHKILLGTPSPDFLSPAAARALHRHLTLGWGMTNPRVQLMVDSELMPTRNLIINRSLKSFPDQNLVAAQTRMLTWYLPPNRIVMLMPDSWDESAMTPLTDLFAAVAA